MNCYSFLKARPIKEVLLGKPEKRSLFLLFFQPTSNKQFCKPSLVVFINCSACMFADLNSSSLAILGTVYSS